MFAVLLVALSGLACAGRDRGRAETQADLARTMACTLGSTELAERKELLKQLAAGVQERKQLDDGIAYRFDPEAGVVARLAEVIELERECCQFLAFRITVAENEGPVWLELTGPKDLIEQYIGGE